LDPSVKYTWTFGDLNGSELASVNHRYKVAGTYTACLTAYRNDSCATTTCKSLVVSNQINCDSVELAFNDYISTSAPNQVYFYTTQNSPLSQMTWTITGITNPADSAVLLQTSPVYVFSDTGYYNVCLQAITVGGCMKTVCKTIHISAIVVACELYTYPNPVQSLATVNLQLGFPETISANLYTAENVLVAQVTQQGNIGNNVVSFNTANLAAGFYTIKFIYGNNLCYAKFQKL
jgi:PKD repeat protein